MTKRIIASLALGLACALPSCTLGDAVRELDTRKDLTGLDLHYLQEMAESESEENSESVEGRFAGFPFWFAPVVTLNAEASNTLHRGEARVEGDKALAPATAYEHLNISALGLGLAYYNRQQGTWDLEGELDRWESTWGVGWGLIFHSETSGDVGGLSNRRSAKFLCGLLGYTGDEQQSTLHLLWLPIPIW